MVNSKQLKPATDKLTPIADFANAWGVSEKTAQNWVEFTYQAFEILLPNAGPFPEWGIEILTICAKHVSEKASLYYAETSERRRLKGTEYVKKIRSMRLEGHFQGFQKFQKLQNFQHLEPDQELADDTFSELGAIARRNDSNITRIKETIEAEEDAEIEELATFIEDADLRKMSKLARRLKTGQPRASGILEAVDVTFRQLPSK